MCVVVVASLFGVCFYMFFCKCRYNDRWFLYGFFCVFVVVWKMIKFWKLNPSRYRVLPVKKRKKEFSIIKLLTSFFFIKSLRTESTKAYWKFFSWQNISLRIACIKSIVIERYISDFILMNFMQILHWMSESQYGKRNWMRLRPKIEFHREPLIHL